METVGAETYRIPCSACQQPFDAASASWCSCVTSEPSLVCPSCGSCFCRSTLAYKRDFWRGAPASLRSQRPSDARTSIPVAPSAPSPAPDPGRRPDILFVDDSPVARQVAINTIRGLGYDLMVASDGAKGLEMALRYRPRLVLTDALMPGMDGREMCRRIKEDPACAGTRVFVMTALYTGVKYEHEAYRTFKVDGYLAKPLPLDELCALLEKELETQAVVA